MGDRRRETGDGSREKGERRRKKIDRRGFQKYLELII